VRIERKAKRYASVLLAVSRERNAVEEVYASLTLLSRFVKKEAVFRTFFLSHRLVADQKIEVLDAILEESCHPLAKALFGLLAERREQNLLSEIARVFEMMRADELQILEATAFTAEELLEDEYSAIRESLAGSTGQTVEFKAKVDPELLGGLKLRLGNLFIDGSIRGRLHSLKRELTIKQ